MEITEKSKTFLGYSPFPWQLAVHRGLDKNGVGSGAIHCVKAKRQIGKSMIIINELLRTAINYGGTNSCCVSPTLPQGRKIYKQIINAIIDSGIIYKKNDSLLEITLVNYSTIVFKSAEQRESLRGYTFSGILCIDEAAFIDDDIWALLKPTTDVYKCPVLMVSSPKYRAGFFFETYNFGFLDKYKGKIFSYDMNDYDTSVLLSNDTLNFYKEILPKAMFMSEYMGEFLDSDSIVFGKFKHCINKNPINDNYKELYIGIDWATGVGKDDTVVTGINERNEQVFLLYFNNKSTTEQIAYISEFLKPYEKKIKGIYSEYNSIGTPLTQLLREKLPKIKIEQFIQKNETKADLVTALQVAFERNEIKIIDDEKQIAELSMYECTISRKGNAVYNAPKGGNDDICIALMLAWKRKVDNGKKGTYNISII